MKKIFNSVPKDIIIGAFIVLILACNVEEIIGIVIFAIWILYIVLGIAKANRGNKSRYLIKYCPCWKKNYLQIFVNSMKSVSRMLKIKNSRKKQFYHVLIEK